MIIGVPTEVKVHEYRVGLTPSSVQELVLRGHEVVVQSGAGLGIGVSDDDYQQVGASILPDAKAVFERSDMIVKVKEPQPQECRMLRKDQILFTYLHLAPDPEQAKGLIESGCTAVAYETVTDIHGRLPLLTPMSEVAGRLSVQVGAHTLEKPNGGRGVLLGGVPGVAPAHVVVIGGGVVGTQAMRMAVGAEAQVTLLDTSLQRLRELDAWYGSRVQTMYATTVTIEEQVKQADLVIGAVLIPGASAPKLVSRALLSAMKPNSVLVDVAIDQGGCFETSHATTHAEPTYEVDGVVHYCVANMPGAVPRTSSFALNNATLPFVLKLADHGLDALRHDVHLRDGLNVHQGHITHASVASSLGLDYASAESVL